jgi:hypothetical protein
VVGNAKTVAVTFVDGNTYTAKVVGTRSYIAIYAILEPPAIAYGVGQGILTTKDKQRATWIAHDIGRTNDNNGAIIYHGVMFFSSNSTGKLAFLNNLEGLYITQVNGSKQTTKMWKWK